ncbi:Rap1a/Tai family immunity protein [Paracoccus haeundaensis]|uniref:Rap1a immunity protein domain-containing protein n=1 Tax=Paracoccus haeundaensis TaxID=225362 RepID=A0A5C4RAL8_9RHOB|nr:Rap1a/Tai family immunity protein [Paracoccus haeundaensis]TNH40942.1 hypothetical protein FHD67_02635 [Paracoccus haeundaensis]
MKTSFAAVYLIIGAGVAFGDNTDGFYMMGNDLYEGCTDSHSGVAEYVMAVFDYSSHVAWTHKAMDARLCSADGVKSSQLRDVVCMYLQNNPTTRHEEAASLVSQAIREAYPCTN